jgi:ElaA protein
VREALSPIRFEQRHFSDLGIDLLYELLQLRGDVFVVEQACHLENEVDGKDPDALHILGFDEDGRLAAAARLHVNADPASVSRIVVRKDLRSRGVGAALMREVETLLAGRAATMSAQARLESWYGRLGWTRVGPVYDDAGIPHVRMVRNEG